MKAEIVSFRRVDNGAVASVRLGSVTINCFHVVADGVKPPFVVVPHENGLPVVELPLLVLNPIGRKLIARYEGGDDDGDD